MSPNATRVPCTTTFPATSVSPYMVTFPNAMATYGVFPWDTVKVFAAETMVTFGPVWLSSKSWAGSPSMNRLLTWWLLVVVVVPSRIIVLSGASIVPNTILRTSSPIATSILSRGIASEKVSPGTDATYV